MYEINIITSFSAAHYLREYRGKCEAMHGHNWKVEVVVAKEDLDSLGMVMDFSELKRLAGEAIEILDHKNINDIDYFKHRNPSSEEISRFLFDILKGKLSERGCLLRKVLVWETDSSCAAYTSFDKSNP